MAEVSEISVPGHCSTNKCRGCVRELGNKAFVLRILGEPITNSAQWCHETQELGLVFERIFKSYHEDKKLLLHIASFPAIIDEEQGTATIPLGLWNTISERSQRETQDSISTADLVELSLNGG